jgi:hypothetical protein
VGVVVDVHVRQWLRLGFDPPAPGLFTDIFIKAPIASALKNFKTEISVDKITITNRAAVCSNGCVQ